MMIKLAGGEELSGSRRTSVDRKKEESNRLVHCQRVVNKLQKRSRSVCVCEFLGVCV